MSIALIAGTGGLPAHIAASLMSQGRALVICEMRGFPSEVEGDFTRVPFRIETLGSFLKTLTSLGVTEVCMAGAMQRPKVDPSAIDGDTAPMVPRLLTAMGKGDDGTLTEVIEIFREHGFAVVGAHQIASDLVPMAGVPTIMTPPDMMITVAAAQIALVEMGRADQGQAMLLNGETVIAREDMRGTAAMLQDFADHGDPKGGSIVLYKAPKPGQNMLVDMPLIGPDTAMQAAQAGLSGIIIPVGGVMVLDLAKVVEVLNAHGLFLWITP
jgi:DUF1009 family protein